MINYGISLLSIVPVRNSPKVQEAQSSQLLFGETFSILEKWEEWLKICTDYDKHTGWVDRKAVTLLYDEQYAELMDHPAFLVDSQIAYLEHADMQFPVVMGSSLPAFNYQEMELTIADRHFSFQGIYKPIELQSSRDLIVKNALRLKGSPYLWGGRSLFGMDCSGFVQMVFKQCGFSLARETWQQAGEGMPLAGEEHAEAGDLAFFYNNGGSITHVGIFLNEGEIIHAHGRVRTDLIDEKGIRNRETGERTHHLAHIRRYIKTQ